jgi:hypothetical protein
MNRFQNYLATFPKLPGSIEQVQISKKYWKQFLVVLELWTGPIYSGSSGNSSRKIHGSFGNISKTVSPRLDS